MGLVVWRNWWTGEAVQILNYCDCCGKLDDLWYGDNGDWLCDDCHPYNLKQYQRLLR